MGDRFASIQATLGHQSNFYAVPAPLPVFFSPCYSGPRGGGRRVQMPMQ
jgi:hypothetical protein